MHGKAPTRLLPMSTIIVNLHPGHGYHPSIAVYPRDRGWGTTIVGTRPAVHRLGCSHPQRPVVVTLVAESLRYRIGGVLAQHIEWLVVQWVSAQLEDQWPG